jgi:hypothetical protein
MFEAAKAVAANPQVRRMAASLVTVVAQELAHAYANRRQVVHIRRST